MRKILLISIAGSMCIFLSCNDTAKVAGTSSTDKVEKNIQADNMISSAFGTGDLTKIDSAVADDYLDHTERGDKVGKDSLKAMIQWVRANFKDMKMEMVKQVADSDYVFSMMRFTGTSDGTVGGMAAGPYDMKSLQVTRFRDGKAVEHWEYMPTTEMMKMVEMMGQQQKPMKVDTAVKKK